jgi:hypothetical protein
MKTKIILCLLGAILLLSSQALAGSSDRLGTAGAQELRIPVGSRAVSLGGAVIADVSGAEAIYWNPAGMSAINKTEAVFSHMEYIADVKLNYFAAMTHLGGFGNLGLSAKILSIGDIVHRTEDNPEGDGEIFSPTFSVIGLTYSRQLTDRVSFGATSMYINEKIRQEQASGLAFDFGFQYAPGWRGLRLGAVIKNLGPNMKFDGPGFEQIIGTEPRKSESAPFELPSSVNFGISYDIYNYQNNRLMAQGAFQSNNFSEDEFRFGAEYSFKDMFFLRGGYTASNQTDYIYGPTAGAGLKLKVSGTDITVDYCWAKTDFFKDNQVFTVKFAF